MTTTEKTVSQKPRRGELLKEKIKKVSNLHRNDKNNKSFNGSRKKSDEFNEQRFILFPSNEVELQ